MLQKLRAVFKRIAQGKEDWEEGIKDIQRALILGDVDLFTVKELGERIRKKVNELPKGLSKREALLRILYDELIAILGESYKPRMDKHKILLVGLYGSGKTTTAAKLARFYQKRGLKVLLIGADVYRPAAKDQLKQLAEKIGVPVFCEGEDPVKIVQEGLKKGEGYDVIIIDSAGRDSLNEELIDEIKKIQKVAKPEETFLVVSADIGKGVKNQLDAFDVSGVIVTKADASGKAGGALTACYRKGVKIAFIGTGEKLDDIEVYDAKRFVARLLGMPDFESFIEKAKEVAEEIGEVEEFNLETFYKQIEGMKKMGPLKKVLEKLGLVDVPEEMLEMGEEKLKIWKYIIDSMTKEERRNPHIINASRIKRIAKGSGRKEEEVRELLKYYKQMEKMYEKLKKGRIPRKWRFLLKGMKWGF